MDIDALDGATALAVVVERAVGQTRGGRGHVDVVAHIDRILAAQLELDRGHATGHRLGDAPARAVRTGEEHPVELVSQQLGADGAVADDDAERVDGHAGVAQHRPDGQTGQGGVLGGLVQHGVARQQGRDEHVRADEVRVVPRRDVGDHPEGFVGDDLGQAGIGVDEHRLVGQHAGRPLEEEVEARQHAAELVAALGDGLAGLGGERVGQVVELAHDQPAECSEDLHPLVDRARRPFDLRRPRRGDLGRDRLGRVVEDPIELGAGGRIDDLHEGSTPTRVAATKSAISGSGANWSDPCQRRELGMPLHPGDVGRARPADGLDQPVGHRTGLDLEPVGQVLDGLVVHAVDGDHRPAPRRRCRPGATRGQLDGMGVGVVPLPVPVAAGTRALRGDVLVERPPEGHVEDLDAAADAQHGLGGGDEGVDEGDLVRVALAIALPIGPPRLLAVGARAHVRAALQDEPVEVVDVVVDGRAARGRARQRVGERTRRDR